MRAAIWQRCRAPGDSGLGSALQREDPAGLLDRKAHSAARRLDEEHRRALAALVESGPIPAVHGVVRWRRKDLVQWRYEEFGLVVAGTTVGQKLRGMGFRRLTRGGGTTPGTSSGWRLSKNPPRRADGAPGAPANRHHDRDLAAGRGPRRPKEQDHPALGSTRHPTQRAARPAHHVGLQLLRHLPGPGQGRPPRAAQVQHSGHATPSRRDRTGRRAGRPCSAHARSSRRAHERQPRRARNITLLPLSPKAPELNPTENVRQFLRNNSLSNRVSAPTTISSTTAATPGTSSQNNQRTSCPSAYADGSIGTDQ